MSKKSVSKMSRRVKLDWHKKGWAVMLLEKRAELQLEGWSETAEENLAQVIIEQRLNKIQKGGLEIGVKIGTDGSKKRRSTMSRMDTSLPIGILGPIPMENLWTNCPGVQTSRQWCNGCQSEVKDADRPVAKITGISYIVPDNQTDSSVNQSVNVCSNPNIEQMQRANVVQ